MQSKATSNQLEKQMQDLRKIPENKRCFDCDQQGTNYVVPTIGIFVCQSCAGLHRDFNRVKGISVCSFSQQEIELLTKVGNKNAKSIWLATYKESDFATPDRKDIHRCKEFIRLKYQQKR